MSERTKKVLNVESAEKMLRNKNAERIAEMMPKKEKCGRKRRKVLKNKNAENSIEEEKVQEMCVSRVHNFRSRRPSDLTSQGI
jgi:hypothetical protein